MALLAHQLHRWFNSIKLSSFVAAAQITERFPRPGERLLHGFSCRPLMSPDCLYPGLKTHRTFSLWTSSWTSNSNGRENHPAHHALLPAENQPSQETQKLPDFGSELSPEGNSELQEQHPLRPSLTSFIWVSHLLLSAGLVQVLSCTRQETIFICLYCILFY